MSTFGAAKAVRDRQADAYASVGSAHTGSIEQNPDWNVDLVVVPAVEKPPAFGSFGFALDDDRFQSDIDNVLCAFPGSDAHRRMAARFGFSDAEVDLVAVAESQ